MHRPMSKQILNSGCEQKYQRAIAHRPTMIYQVPPFSPARSHHHQATTIIRIYDYYGIAVVQ